MEIFELFRWRNWTDITTEGLWKLHSVYGLPGLDEATFMNEALPEHKEVWQKYRAEGVRGYVEDSLHPETANVLSDAEDEMFANFADVQTTLQSLQDQINQIVSQ